jgi:predicted ATPase
MFKQRLIVENFGPLKNVDFELSNVNVFIGQQASGKSTIVKSVYFFKIIRNDFIKQIFSSIANKSWENKVIGEFAKTIRGRFIDFWGPTFHLEDISLKFFYAENHWISISLKQPNKFIDPHFSKSFESGIYSIVDFAKSESKRIESKSEINLSLGDAYAIETEKSLLNQSIIEQINRLFQESRKLLFIPAGRSLISLLTDHLSGIAERQLDQISHTFIREILSNQRFFNHDLKTLVNMKRLTSKESTSDNETLKDAARVIKNILKGDYRFDKDGEKLFIDKKRFVKLNYASSGQQETVWILLLIYLQLLNNTPTFLIVEEPEAHLHPSAQKEIIDYLVLFSNFLNNQVMITTHSPYVLSSLNNLLFASQVGKVKSNEVNRLISEKLWLQADKTSVCMVRSGGILSIVDPDTNLIKTEEIDKISFNLNEVFEKLYNLSSDL